MNSIENHVPENVICCLCAISVKADQLESHLGLIHFNCDPYQCEPCFNEDLPSKFPTEIAIKQHMKEKHQVGKFWYRTWSSADIDQDKANINACLLQSIQNTAKCMGNEAKSGSEAFGHSSRVQDSANMASYQIAPENHLAQTSSKSRSTRKNMSSKLAFRGGLSLGAGLRAPATRQRRQEVESTTKRASANKQLVPSKKKRPIKKKRGDGFPVREERLMNVMAHRLVVEGGISGERYSLGSAELWVRVLELLKAQGLAAGRSSESLRKHHQRNTERCIVCNPYSGDELPSTWSLVLQ
ncbi:hypothetical protein Ddc_19089 [Ditylenchus destructor]|nr:hypothetical protein Ddc_19089 [Ditylenchus destructor]